MDPFEIMIEGTSLQEKKQPTITFLKKTKNIEFQGFLRSSEALRDVNISHE
jgi:hypothetical protein